MKKIKILLTLFIFPLFISEAQVLQYPATNEYPAVQAAFIRSGDTEQEVKCFMDVKAGSVGHESPTTWAMSPDGKIYIADDLKKRIAIYDLDGNYIRQIKNNKNYINYLTEIKVANDGSIFCFSYFDGALVKLNTKGELIYRVERKNLSPYYEYDGYFPYNDYLFYYDKKHKIKCLDPQGENMSDEEINNLTSIIKTQEVKNNGIRSINSFESKIDNFLKKESLLIIDDKLLSNKLSKYYELWNIMNSNMEIQKIKSDYWAKSMKESDDRIGKAKVQRGDIITADDMEEYRKNAGSLIGYDSDGNLAFQGRNGITIIDKYGNVLDAFNCKDMERYSAFVAPSGDIYFIKRTKEGVTFYKVVRRW